MKATRTLLAFFSAMVAASIASAQTIEFMFVTKLRDYEQTTDHISGDPALISNPYIVVASISGADGDPLTSGFPVSPTVAVQNGTQSSITLTHNDDEWHFESAGYPNQGDLNLAYGSGNYTFQSSSFTSTILSLTDTDLYPNAPEATITTNTGLGFSWSGDVLLVNPTLFTTLTVTTNVFGTNFNASTNHIGISGDNFSLTEVNEESFNTAANTLSVDISAANFLSGSANKSIEIEFNNITQFFEDTPSLGITAVSAFTSVTSFSIQVIPEPSTYVAIFGGLALVGVVIHRRRRQLA